MSERVAKVLSRWYPSYHEPLAIARQWNRGTSPEPDDFGKQLAASELLEDAGRLLKSLAEDKYPTALGVWYEAAFNRVRRLAPLTDPAERAATREKALELLQHIDVLFGGRLDEDTYALWGRCYKDAGHEHLDRGLEPAPPAAPGEAEREPTGRLVQSGEATAADAAYREAEKQYEKGYKLSLNWFPGINTAFLRFMRAALAAQLGCTDESTRLLAEAQTRARELLDATGWKIKLPDDDIWHEATRGEAHALRGEWPAALGHYREALARPGLQPYHPESMSGQLGRIVQGWQLLGRPLPRDVKNQLAELFRPHKQSDVLHHALAI